MRHELASVAPMETAPSVALTPAPVDTVVKPVAPSKPVPLGFQGIRPGYPEEFRRIRSPLEEYKLRTQLADSPQIELESSPGGAAVDLLAHARAHHGSWAEPAPHPPLLTCREDLAGLPLLMGSECYMSDAQAVSLQELSGRLHSYLSDAKETGEKSAKSTHIEGTAGANYLGARLQMDSQALWQTSDAVPTLVQILQVEEAPYRRLLVRLLSRIGGPRATEALARRAVFDLARIVREEAVYALRDRPEADYRAILLDGLRHPWPAAAEFAAEAIVNLNQTSAIPQLVEILRRPDPSKPTAVKSKNGDQFVVREMVQVNHLKNCLLCHAASANEADRVRGLVPNPNRAADTSNQTPIKSFGIYGGGGGRFDFFARAEVTYLRQDFSVMRPVHKDHQASHDERFDFVVRTRPASLCELTEKPAGNDYPQRRSVLFALRELTGEDLGGDARAWEQRLYPGLTEVNGAAANHH